MVVYEDNHLLVVNKNCGELVQGDATRDETILDTYKSYLKKKYNKPGNVFLHPTHRLDRPVSGCVILARTSKALSRMNETFRMNAIQKLYHAISHQRNSMTEGRLEHFLIKDSERNKSRVVKKGNKAKKAILRFELESVQEGKYLYGVHPQTGRSHQIRVQLSTAGSPILGDLKYGGTKIKNIRQIYLHCSSMVFIHPVKKELMQVSCFPQTGDYWKGFKPFLRESINAFNKKIESEASM